MAVNLGRFTFELYRGPSDHNSPKAAAEGFLRVRFKVSGGLGSSSVFEALGFSVVLGRGL